MLDVYTSILLLEIRFGAYSLGMEIRNKKPLQGTKMYGRAFNKKTVAEGVVSVVALRSTEGSLFTLTPCMQMLLKPSEEAISLSFVTNSRGWTGDPWRRSTLLPKEGKTI